MTRLDGRCIVITGSGAGLGREYALAAAAAGAVVVVNDVDGDAARSTASDIADRGGSAIPVVGSVASWKDSAQVIATALAEFGRLDGVVANAAIMHMSEPWSEDEARLRATAEINILGAQFTVRHAMRAMVEAGSGGAIVTVVSGAMFGNRGMSAYGASKGAVAAATANWAIEGAPHGIRVNAISPWALTRMTCEHLDRTGVEPAAFPEPAAIAPVVVSLLSEDLIGITGKLIRFDGSRLSFYETTTVEIAERDSWTADAVSSAIVGRFPRVHGPIDSYRVQ